MPRTPDAAEGPRFEEETVYDRTSSASIGGPGSQRFDDATGRFEFEDDVGTYDPRTGGGIDAVTHRGLDQLVHLVAETSYLELTRTSGRVSDIIYWTDNTKTTKVRETNITRTSGQVSQIVVKQYDGTGTLNETLTGTVTRTSGQASSIDWVLT
jgi:hypothetical protein